jgi:hypothetical protein
VERGDLGFIDNPANGLGIVRARTLLGNLRLWDIPRTEQALDLVIREIGIPPIPGLYILIDERSGRRAYVGQTEDLSNRLLDHIRSPENKIQHWQRAVILNDGRNASQSDLNDENIRLSLEDYLVSLLRINRYEIVTAATRSPSISAIQAILFNAFREEINILLSHKGKISRLLTGKRDDEIFLEDAKRILAKKGYHIETWGEKYATVNGQPVVIRPGSLKAKGWQVTFRGSKSLSFLQKGEGYLLMPRGPLVLLPLEEIRDFILSIDPLAFQRDTVDIFIRFDESRLVLAYKQGEKEITAASVLPYLEN